MEDFIFNISVPVKKAKVMLLPAKQKIIRFSNRRLELIINQVFMYYLKLEICEIFRN